MALVMRIFVVILLMAVSAGTLAWISLPYIAPIALSQALQTYAWDLEKLVLQRPVDLNLYLDELRILDQAGALTIEASDIVLKPANASLNNLAIDIDHLTITVASSDQESPLELQALLGTYISVLPLALNQGRIHELELCLPSLSRCIITKLTWWREQNGLQARAESGEYPLTYNLYAYLTDRSLNMEFFQSGEKSIAAELQATWPDMDNVHLAGTILSTDDTLLKSALPALPDELSVDLQALSAAFDLQLPLKTIQQVSDLTDYIRGEIRINAPGNFRWDADKFSLQSNQPIIASLKLMPDELTILIAPGMAIDVLIPDIGRGEVTNQAKIVCNYRISLNDTRCSSHNLMITAKYISEPITATLLASDISLELPAHKPMSVNASIDLVIKEAHESRLTAKAHIALSNSEIHLVSSSLNVEGLNFDRFELVHSLDSNKGELQSGFSGNTTALSRWFKSPINGDFVVDQEVKWHGSFASDWQQWPVTITSRLKGSNLAGEFDGYTFKEGELNLTLTGWSQLTTPEPARMNWKEIDVGFPMRHTRLSFNLSLDPFSGSFHIQGISAQTEILGGKVSSDSYAYSSDSGDGYLLLILDTLDLLQVLSLEQENFYAEGKLNGRVPVKIEKNQILIEDGVIEAIAPGGIIQYKPSDSVTSLAKSSPQMAMVLETLENFRYDTLGSNVDFGSDGILHLSTSLTGSNPDFEGGRKINFNLNVEEDIAALLESLRLSDKITKRIDEKFSN